MYVCTYACIYIYYGCKYICIQMPIYIYTNINITLLAYWQPPVSQAQALVDEGYMEALLDLEKLGWYWRNMLLDYPTHPASDDPEHSLPITLYGILAQLF